MMGNNDTDWTAMSDAAIVAALGEFVKHHRLEQNKTQMQLAEEAGIHRSTLHEFERGARANVLTLIQLLRALNLLYVLQDFEAKPQISPIELAKLERARRKRATGAKKQTKRPASDW